MAWISVITNAGLALLAAGKPHIESVWGGSGTVKEAALLAQTELAEPRQQGSIVAYEALELGSRLKLQFGAADEEYMLRQIGIFAKPAGEAGDSVLFALIQNPEGIKVSAKADWPSFVYTHYCQMSIANAAEFTVDIDGGALVSMSTLQEALKSCLQLDESGKIPDEVLPSMDYIPKADKGKAGGVATLDTSGKVPNSQLDLDAEMSATSEKPVKNRIVQAALTSLSNALTNAVTSLNQALSGKAASNHTHLYAGSSSAGGAANSAVKLQTARSVQVNLGSTAATNFDGSGNANPGVYGILGISNGGTGANNAAQARANLGITPANIGASRIVTGIYTGNGEKRTVTNYALNTATGGQFISLGIAPKLVLIWQACHQNPYYYMGTYNYPIINSIDIQNLVANGGKVQDDVAIELTGNGFWVGTASGSTKTNTSGYVYGYLAII